MKIDTVYYCMSFMFSIELIFLKNTNQTKLCSRDRVWNAIVCINNKIKKCGMIANETTVHKRPTGIEGTWHNITTF